MVTAATLVPARAAGSEAETELVTLDDALSEEGQDVPFPASHLAVRWEGDEDAGVEVRGRVGGNWQPWERATPAHDLEDDARGLTYSGVLRAEGATRLQARVVAGTARSVKVTAINSEEGPRPPAPASGAASAAGAAQPPVISRAQWGADESLREGGPSFAPIRKLIVHHTVTENDDPDPAATIRAVYAYHTRTRGWSDIGYNFLVDAQGRIYEGRYSRPYGPGETPTGEDRSGRGVIGSHAEGHNTGSVGVSLLGDFSSVEPRQAAVDSLQAMLAWKSERHGIQPYGYSDGIPNIAGHRDTKATACPGNRLYDRLPAIRQAVAGSPASAQGPTRGYWVAGRDGGVFTFGDARFFGSAGGMRLNQPVVGMAATPSGNGYWLVASDGGIFTFGDARFFGSTGSMHLNQPVMGMAATPSGNGYWLVASDGGIFTFGDARFSGSTGSMHLNQPVVGMAATPSGDGYWLVASDGGIFSFGDARFSGSTGSIRLHSPVVGMHGAPGGDGYWLVARDGGVFTFNVPFHGSVPGLRLRAYPGSVGLGGTSTAGGYYVLAADGGIIAFGDARHLGARSGLAGARAAVDMALLDPAPVVP